MSRPDDLRHHGDEVMVFDAKGNFGLFGAAACSMGAGCFIALRASGKDL